MTWARQVAHIVGKDVREWKLMYALYVVVVILATLHGVGLFSRVTVFEASVPFVIFAGMLLVAVVVQGDSATRADAFWASRPLHPTAVGAAKVCQALIVIALAGVGQAIAMRSHALPADMIAPYLLVTAGSFSLWIAAALALAVITRTVQAAILAFIGSALALGLLFASVENSTPSLSATMRVAVGVVQAILALGVLFLLYRARDRRVWMSIASCVACVAPWTMMLPNQAKPLARATVIRTLRIARADTLSFDRAEIPLQIMVDGITAAQHATLSDIVVNFTLTSGQVLHVLRQYYVPLTLGDSVPTPFPLRWIGHSGLPTVAATLTVKPSESERKQLAGGVRAISIEGELFVNEPTFVGVLPLQAGAQLNLRGQHALVDSVRFVGSDVQARVFTSSPDENASMASFDPYMLNVPRFALVNEVRMEAIDLPGASVSSHTAWLVMPGMSITEQTYSLSLRRPMIMNQSISRSDGRIETSEQFTDSSNERVVPVDSEWLRNAKLLMFNWKGHEMFFVRGVLNVQ